MQSKKFHGLWSSNIKKTMTKLLEVYEKKIEN